MEHLETQVSDLRSFLPAATSSSSSSTSSSAAAAATAATTATTTTTTSTTSTPIPSTSTSNLHHLSSLNTIHRHPPPRHIAAGASQQQAATSPLSALGDNSAHPSPLTTPTHHQYHSHINHSTNNPAASFYASSGSGSGSGSSNAHPKHHQHHQQMNASILGGGLTATTPTAAAGTKRKPDDSPLVGDDTPQQKQQRSKRNRYISIACNECKRRKIKCNGETPCQRCGNLNLACLYAPNCCSNSFKESEEYKQMNDNISHLQDQMDSLSRLQEQMDILQRQMSAIQKEPLRLAPIQENSNRALPPPPSSTGPIASSPSASISSSHRQDLPPFRPPVLFRGPTSATSHVDVAKNTLHNMGYTGAEANEDIGMPLEETPAASPAPVPDFAREPPSRPQDPLWDFDVDEMVRLCRIHEEEVGIMYPVVNINDVINHARSLAERMTTARRHGYYASQDEINGDVKTLELKIIMCCALVVEGNGYSPKANRLWENIQPIVDRMLMSDPSRVTNLPFLALVGGYRFLANEEVLAWRVMGQVARLCLEMGLHRRDGIAKIDSEQARKNAVNTFWSAYVLDRRWSFGTGFPFVVHDDKVDPGLPYPEDYPYLTSLIAFSKLSAKIWRLVDYFDSVLIRELKREDFVALDQEILDWYDNKVPEKIRISTLGDRIPIPGTPTYDIDRLQIWTRLRLNQIRIWLYTPVLHSASSITQNNDLAQRVVNLAKDTIQYLTLLNHTSVVYRRMQVFYHHFLTSSIAVLFVASTHAPVHFSAQCREEFNMALELIKDLSPKSWVSQRLWRTVKSLKAYAPKLGLQQDEHNTPQSGGNMGMAGLSTGGQHGIHSTASTNRGSISSAGHQPTPSPAALTPGAYGGGAGQDRNGSRMRSTTPHRNGGTSPLPNSTMDNHHHHHQNHHHNNGAPSHHGNGGNNNYTTTTTASPTDDKNNGIRLQTEMLRMYEGFGSGVGMGGHGMHGGDAMFGTMGSGGGGGEYATAGGHHYGMGGDGEGVFPLMKEMF